MVIFVAGLVGESVWYSFFIVLRRYEVVSAFLPKVFRLNCYSTIVPTLPCNVFNSVSRFCTVASATGTETAGPVAAPVAWSKNCTRMLPRLSGIVSIAC